MHPHLPIIQHIQSNTKKLNILINHRCNKVTRSNLVHLYLFWYQCLFSFTLKDVHEQQLKNVNNTSSTNLLNNPVPFFPTCPKYLDPQEKKTLYREIKSKCKTKIETNPVVPIEIMTLIYQGKIKNTPLYLSYASSNSRPSCFQWIFSTPNTLSVWNGLIVHHIHALESNSTFSYIYEKSKIPPLIPSLVRISASGKDFAHWVFRAISIEILDEWGLFHTLDLPECESITAFLTILPRMHHLLNDPVSLYIELQALGIFPCSFCELCACIQFFKKYSYLYNTPDDDEKVDQFQLTSSKKSQDSDSDSENINPSENREIDICKLPQSPFVIQALIDIEETVNWTQAQLIHKPKNQFIVKKSHYLDVNLVRSSFYRKINPKSQKKPNSKIPFVITSRNPGVMVNFDPLVSTFVSHTLESAQHQVAIERSLYPPPQRKFRLGVEHIGGISKNSTNIHDDGQTRVSSSSSSSNSTFQPFNLYSTLLSISQIQPLKNINSEKTQESTWSLCWEIFDQYPNSENLLESAGISFKSFQVFRSCPDSQKLLAKSMLQRITSLLQFVVIPWALKRNLCTYHQRDRLNQMFLVSGFGFNPLAPDFQVKRRHLQSSNGPNLGGSSKFMNSSKNLNPNLSHTQKPLFESNSDTFQGSNSVFNIDTDLNSTNPDKIFANIEAWMDITAQQNPDHSFSKTQIKNFLQIKFPNVDMNTILSHLEPKIEMKIREIRNQSPP